ncbi:hypothetical protein OJ997_05650 [Solirubrobacter phytolaccae]|uniref:DUF2384 domain-containing protein n=1 Tax=Solirubrobacter phytolaccae TaxID=1404360 RepID=A0A9X3N7H1_9ACTN|nr:hypothetical protein [Solirubrobacter phytolaccae]MDA0179769.1 hypothetical protein [Solirubrobacter phytolaccae]
MANALRQGKISGQELQKMLSVEATTSDRVKGLLALGLPPDKLADAVGAKLSTLRNWSSGQAEPRADAAITLDDLRYVALLLLVDGEWPSDRVARWFTSRDFATGQRPLDQIAETPTDVIAAATDLIVAIRAAKTATPAASEGGSDTGSFEAVSG